MARDDESPIISPRRRNIEDVGILIRGRGNLPFFRALTLEGSALSQILFTTYVSKVLD